MISRRIAFIGAGNIAETHAAAIRAIPGLQLVAVVDPVGSRARSFAERWGVAAIHDSVESLIKGRAAEAAHVLVPPPLHRAVAEPVLRAGLHVLLEKPMAQDEAECDALQEAARAGGAALRVNHNFVHHPAHRAARRAIEANRIGPVRHVMCRYNVPLRQLGARQLTHWMFDSPRNLLLEQAVHPLSQIDDLVGSVRDIAAVVAPPLRLGEGQDVHRTWLVSMQCERGTAQLLLSLGETYPTWGMTIVGDDGAIFVDYLNNRIARETSGRAMDLIDGFRNGASMAVALKWQSLANLLAGGASIVKLRPRSDVFFRSMKTSIARFYDDLDPPQGDRLGIDGRSMVELCERIAALAGPPARAAAVARAPSDDGEASDVLVIGGTGFIGSRVVAKLVAKGVRVRVLARGVKNLPALFRDPAVGVISGDARNETDITRAIGKASTVINLAHGGGGANWAEIEANLVGGAKTVAGCCLASGVRRLVFVSSIAALYLGDPQEIVTGSTRPDPMSEQRGEYARAKGLAETALLDLHRAQGLPVVILRPGVVIGEGTSPFHSGIGYYNHETHCLGWNLGRNPLPLVLVDDVADAIMSALDAAGVEGKCYNLVGDVRLTAREYVLEMSRATGRPLRFHPQPVAKIFGIELMKSAVKKLSGRRDPWPSLRDFKSRGLAARFDCSAEARELGWNPVGDRAEFLRQGFEVHARSG
jgi:predicted dehydrogenase/nucleoside-diphosphate-sugar epimerase